MGLDRHRSLLLETMTEEWYQHRPEDEPPGPRRLRKHRGAAVAAGLGGWPPVAGPGARSAVAVAAAGKHPRSPGAPAPRLDLLRGPSEFPQPKLLYLPRPQGELEEEAVKELHKMWGEPRTVRFRFSWVSAGACAFLAADDSAAACRLLASAHAAGWYSDRALHISL